MNKPNYLKGVDGLRALAVISVLLYHVDFAPFSGGHIGVDVFFVISGFLITRLIRDEIDAGTFSFANFYTRRARRILPALFFTLGATFSVAALLFSPAHLERLSAALVYAVFSISNIFFWQETGYFDLGAEYKPLLHTWSLAVEEQFYLVWPAIIVFCLTLKRNIAPLFILLVGLVSLYYSEIWITKNHEAAFYLAPFRVFEFSIGALVVWLRPFAPRGNATLELMMAAGLMAVVVPVFYYTTETPFPGLMAMVPCAGAALIIIACDAKYTGMLLRNSISVKTGLISYSLYLVHWPIIVFYKYYTLDALNFTEKIAIIVLSIVCATLMYIFVETPIRRAPETDKHLRPAAFGFACALIAAILIIPASHSWANDGWTWRLSNDTASVAKNLEGQKDNRKEQTRDRICHITRQSKTFSHSTNILADCNQISDGAILVVGDSYAADLWMALKKNLPSHNFIQLTGAACWPGDNNPKKKYCQDLYNYSKQYVKAHKQSIKMVVFSQRGTVLGAPRFLTNTLRYLDFFRQQGVDVVWVGPHMEYKPRIPELLVKSSDRNHFEDLVNSSRWLPIYQIDSRLELQANKRNIPYISLIDTLCDGDSCPVLDHHGNSLYIDYAHWTPEAAKYLGKKLLTNSNLLNLIIN